MVFNDLVKELGDDFAVSDVLVDDDYSIIVAKISLTHILLFHNYMDDPQARFLAEIFINDDTMFVDKCYFEAMDGSTFLDNLGFVYGSLKSLIPDTPFATSSVQDIVMLDNKWNAPEDSWMQIRIAYGCAE